MKMSTQRFRPVWLALALAVAAPAAPPKEPTSAPAIPTYDLTGAAPAKCVRAISGDLILVELDGKRRKILLIGIEAPPASQPAGQAARERLDQLLRGESLALRFDDDGEGPDRNGYLRAFVHRSPDGLFVNLELLRAGFATVPDSFEHEERQLFLDYAARAKALKKGMFADSPPKRSPQTPPAAPQPAVGLAPPANGENADPADSSAETQVVITASGKKYHLPTCTFAKRASRTLSAADARKQGFAPCSKCKPPNP